MAIAGILRWQMMLRFAGSVNDYDSVRDCFTPLTEREVVKPAAQNVSHPRCGDREEVYRSADPNRFPKQMIIRSYERIISS